MPKISAEEKNQIHKKGQYFTKNEILQEFVRRLILNKPNKILEPSMGRGDLIKYIQSKNKNIKFDLYEIDETIDFLPEIQKEQIHFGDFLQQEINNKYKTIIGNPPYVKTKTGNLYIDFIDRCYELLEDKGELIFIVPSDFIKLTSSGKVINKMIENGTFTHIIHPNRENLFENASIDIIVFRYCKDNTLSNKILVNNEEKFLVNTNGILTFTEKENNNMKTLSEYFKVYVGMVTGRESIYKNEEFGNITLLNKKDQRDKYIFIHKFPTKNEKLNIYMLTNKNTLINRKIKKFTEDDWFKWGAPRNQKNIEKNIGKECIYVSNLTRNKEVAFIGNVEYFGGSLLMMVPKKKIDLKKIVEYLNSEKFKSNYMFSGRFKIGHKQLSNVLFSI
jgi:adenine-specific DNA-methyltransferase